MVFRPRLVPTLFTVPTLIILVALGTWQAQRLAWKSDLLARIDQQLAQPAAQLPANLTDAAQWDYRRVTVTGALLAETELAIASRVLNGRVGWHLVSPLVRADGSAVLVNRGWVPDGQHRATAERAAEIPETVTITAVARVPEEAGWLAPQNDPSGNVWLTVDLRAMEAAAGLDRNTAAPLLLYLSTIMSADGQSIISDQPIPDQVRVDIPNNHLHYMLTWYGLAVVLLGVYIAYHWRRPGGPNGSRDVA